MGYSNDDMTAHGFRAMARTMIAEMRAAPSCDTDTLDEVAHFVEQCANV